ncbi:Transmembrane protein, partial [Trichinella zimbabwensis]
LRAKMENTPPLSDFVFLTSQPFFTFCSETDLEHLGKISMDVARTRPRRRERLSNLTPEQKLQRRKLKNRVAAQCARDRKKKALANLESNAALLETENLYLRASLKEMELANKQLREENARLQALLSSKGKSSSCSDEHVVAAIESAEFINAPLPKAQVARCILMLPSLFCLMGRSLKLSNQFLIHRQHQKCVEIVFNDCKLFDDHLLCLFAIFQAALSEEYVCFLGENDCQRKFQDSVQSCNSAAQATIMHDHCYISSSNAKTMHAADPEILLSPLSFADPRDFALLNSLAPSDSSVEQSSISPISFDTQCELDMGDWTQIFATGQDDDIGLQNDADRKEWTDDSLNLDCDDFSFDNVLFSMCDIEILKANGDLKDAKNTSWSQKSPIAAISVSESMNCIACPSCSGNGYIPRDREDELVALIPFSDKRLKPSKTWMWVISSILICLLLSGLALYFLLPRTINVFSNSLAVTEVFLQSYEPGKTMKVNFMTYVNVSNENFYDIEVTNASSKVSKMVFPSRSEVIGYGFNKSIVVVPKLSSFYPIGLNVTVTLSDWALAMCELSYGYIRLYFQFTLTFSYLLHHREQNTLETSQLVCCNQHGEC